MAAVLSPWRFRDTREEDVLRPPSAAWSYTTHQFQLSGPLSSPPLSPEGAPLAEYASFLPMMESFQLDDDLTTAGAGGKRTAPTPHGRQTCQELESLVQDAFTEMDQTLASQPVRVPVDVRPAHPASAGASYADAANDPIPSSMSWASDLGSLASASEAQWRPSERFSERPSVTPTEEEQDWLESQMDLQMEHGGGGGGGGMDLEDDAEEEGEFVSQMMRMHPNLQEDEARWLFQRQRSSSQLDSG